MFSWLEDTLFIRCVLFLFIYYLYIKGNKMTFVDWVSKNNTKLIEVTNNITRGDKESMDLYQSVMTQLLPQHTKLDNIIDEEKMYYFIRVTKTNWYSKTSPYQYHKKKYDSSKTEYKDYKDFREDEEYTEDIPDMDWVECELHKIGWFEHDLFMLYYETGTLASLHKETSIPINSVGKYIKDIKNELKKRWLKQKNNE